MRAGHSRAGAILMAALAGANTALVRPATGAGAQPSAMGAPVQAAATQAGKANPPAGPGGAEVSPAQAAGIPIPPGQIEKAIAALDGLARDIMRRTGIPGLAVAVVRDGRTVHASGLGVRRAGAGERVDADTVFQVASLSKSVGATVVARAVDQGIVAWDTPVVRHLPWFALSDPWVSRTVTIADMYAHRSGLHEHAGDDLEDLGLDQRQVLERLRFAPLHPFRATYAYTNFGLTAAAEAVAAAAGRDWASLSEHLLYRPLGMASTSSHFADFMARANRASPHVRAPDGTFQPRYQRQPDAQSPAGGVSASAADMARWMALVLGGGVFRGERIMRPEALLIAVTPQVVSLPAAAADARPGLYGYGFGVGTSPAGRVVLSHSGAFGLGAATNYVMIPSAGVGIVILSNAMPIGAVEALGMAFADLVQMGRVTRDWLAAYRPRIEPMNAPFGSLAGRAPPASPAGPGLLSDYEGIYWNGYAGEVGVARQGDHLVLRIGARAFRLRHWDGRTFVFDIHSENASDGSVSAVRFAPGPSAVPGGGPDPDPGGAMLSLRLEFLEPGGNGLLLRRPDRP